MTLSRTFSALSLACLLALTGCAPSADSVEESSIGMASPDIAYTEDMAVGLQVEDGMDRGSLEPDIIRTGFLSLSVDSPTDTADRIT
ncbi:MAG: hypothetical protein O2828_01185, partial [Actinomycetota bacterium]|nr:hypothetical protein [Actinomycetota bacterium]